MTCKLLNLKIYIMLIRISLYESVTSVEKSYVVLNCLIVRILQQRLMKLFPGAVQIAPQHI